MIYLQEKRLSYSQLLIVSFSLRKHVGRLFMVTLMPKGDENSKLCKKITLTFKQMPTKLDNKNEIATKTVKCHIRIKPTDTRLLNTIHFNLTPFAYQS